jgi:hypothetical protein
MSEVPSRQGRWPLVVIALAVAMAVAVAASAWWITSGSQSWARSRWQPPQQALLQSMRARLVPGWKTDVAILGLPPGATITSGDDKAERWPHPLFGSRHESDTYLLATSPGQAAPQWWLVGVDARDGHALFRPVALNNSKVTPRCFANGPAVVCIADDFDTATAWVVDGQTGGVSFTGPTDVRLNPGARLHATQAGDYLVASTEDQGIYGVGPKAETTWFVPGSGRVYRSRRDIAFLEGTKVSHGATMISPKDGKVISPELPEDIGLGSVDFFDGGFAADLETEHTGVGVQFFDPTGHVASRQVRGQLGGTTGNLVGVQEEGGQFGIYGPGGHKLLELPHGPSGMRLIGNTLYAGEDGSNQDYPHYQPYDMRTGDKGMSVEIDLGRRYLGTDGSVALRAVVNPKADQLAKAYDLATGQELWSIPTAAGSLGWLYVVDNTLMQVSDDGTELFSLVPPH